MKKKKIIQLFKSKYPNINFAAVEFKNSLVSNFNKYPFKIKVLVISNLAALENPHFPVFYPDN